MTAGAIILCVISVFFFVMGVRSYAEKGYLFNNAYIFASEQERETMDKRPHYRQTGTVFLLIGLVFLLNGLNLLLKTEWIFYIIIAVIVFTLVYAIVSSIRIEKNK